MAEPAHAAEDRDLRPGRPVIIPAHRALRRTRPRKSSSARSAWLSRRLRDRGAARGWPRDAWRQAETGKGELLAAGSPSALWGIMDQVVGRVRSVVAGLEHETTRSRPPCSRRGRDPERGASYSLRNEATTSTARAPAARRTAIVERAAHKSATLFPRRPGPPDAER